MNACLAANCLKTPWKNRCMSAAAVEPFLLIAIPTMEVPISVQTVTNLHPSWPTTRAINAKKEKSSWLRPGCAVSVKHCGLLKKKQRRAVHKLPDFHFRDEMPASKTIKCQIHVSYLDHFNRPALYPIPYETDNIHMVESWVVGIQQNGIMKKDGYRVRWSIPPHRITKIDVVYEDEEEVNDD